jgi:hypothetical protein
VVFLVSNEDQEVGPPLVHLAHKNVQGVKKRDEQLEEEEVEVHWEQGRMAIVMKC